MGCVYVWLDQQRTEESDEKGHQVNVIVQWLLLESWHRVGTELVRGWELDIQIAWLMLWFRVLYGNLTSSAKPATRSKRYPCGAEAFAEKK